MNVMAKKLFLMVMVLLWMNTVVNGMAGGGMGGSSCTDTDNGALDSQYRPCDFYSSNLQVCSNSEQYNTPTFIANDMCCACGGGYQCVDTNGMNLDSNGRQCNFYSNGNEGMCGTYDVNEVFNANTMCCACSGGRACIEASDPKCSPMCTTSCSTLWYNSIKNQCTDNSAECNPQDKCQSCPNPPSFSCPSESGIMCFPGAPSYSLDDCPVENYNGRNTNMVNCNCHDTICEDVQYCYDSECHDKPKCEEDSRNPNSLECNCNGSNCLDGIQYCYDAGCHNEPKCLTFQYDGGYNPDNCDTMICTGGTCTQLWTQNMNPQEHCQGCPNPPNNACDFEMNSIYCHPGKPDYPQPTAAPSTMPTNNPTDNPTLNPTDNPTLNPTENPTLNPTANPTLNPTANPTLNPTDNPTLNPTENPTLNPTDNPTLNPTANPTLNPTDNPTLNPTDNPTLNPTDNPTLNPTANPTLNPTEFQVPTALPTSTSICNSYQDENVCEANEECYWNVEVKDNLAIGCYKTLTESVDATHKNTDETIAKVKNTNFAAIDLGFKAGAVENGIVRVQANMKKLKKKIGSKCVDYEKAHACNDEANCEWNIAEGRCNTVELRRHLEEVEEMATLTRRRRD